MSLETLDSICQRVFGSLSLDQTLEVVWHSGEPLTVPISWYEEATDLMARTCPIGVRLQHCFQTNGMLISKDWLRFFTRIQARIGLSIDGPAELHDVNRKTRRGNGTHEAVMNAVHLLQEEGHSFHVITVLTALSLDNPENLFDFYVRNGIKEVGFNIEEIEGENAHSSLTGGSIEEKFRRFIRRFFDLVWNAPELLRVREFDNAAAILLSNEPVTDQQNIPFSIVSIGFDGAISTFSPELLGARHPRFNNFIFGHIDTTLRLSDIEREPIFQTINREIQQGLQACHRTCRYFRWCGGGVPANKLFETDRFDATETTHCRLTRQALLDEVIAGIERNAGDSKNEYLR